MIEDIKKWLIENSDKKQREFLAGLIPNSLPIIGVKTPVLRKKAKEIIKDDYELFLEECDDSSLEICLLEAYVIGTAKITKEKRASYLDIFIPKIQDWAINDGLVSSLKCIKKDYHFWFEYLLKYQDSSKEFEVRFLLITLMSYFLTDEYIDLVIDVVKRVKVNAYYAKMGLAWFLATALAKQETKIIELLEEGLFDKEVMAMTISKIRQSFRISPQIKEDVLKYKI